MHHNQSEFQRQGTSGFRRFIEASNASFSLSWDFRSEFFKLLTKSPLQGSSPNLCLSIRVTCICFLELMLRNGKITARVWKDENSIGTQHTWIMTTFSHLQTFLVHLQVQFLHLSKCSRLESGQSHLIQGSQMQTKMLKLYFGWQDWCTTPRSCRRCIMMYIYIYILHMCFGGETHVFSKSFNSLQSRTPWQCCSPNQCRVCQILQEMCQLQPAMSWPLRFKPLKPLIPVLLSPQSSATSRVFQGPAITAGGGCLFANYCQMAYCPSTETHILVQNQNAFQCQGLHILVLISYNRMWYIYIYKLKYIYIICIYRLQFHIIYKCTCPCMYVCMYVCLFMIPLGSNRS